MSNLDEELVRSLLRQQFYEPIDQIIDRYHSVRIPVPGSGSIIEKMIEFFDLTISFIDYSSIFSPKAINFLSDQLKIDQNYIRSTLSSRMNVILDSTQLNDESNLFSSFLLLSGLIESVQQVNTQKVNLLLIDELNMTESYSSEQVNDLISRLPPRWYSEYSILVNLKVLEHYALLTAEPIPHIPFTVYKRRILHALRYHVLR